MQKIPEEATPTEQAYQLQQSDQTHHTKYWPLSTLIYAIAKNLHLYRTHDQCGDTIEKSQAPDNWCNNIRNMLSVEEVK